MSKFIPVLIFDMKYFLLSLLVIIGIVSCQKEITDDVDSFPFDTTIVIKDTGKLEADINGVRWVANKDVKAQFIAADTSGTPAIISISATSTNGRELNFGVIDSGVHVYSVFTNDTSFFSNGAEYSDSTSPSKGSFYSSDSNTTNYIKIGTISITNIDTTNKTITGSFSFRVYRQSDTTSRSFTNGVFTKVPYTKIGGIIPSAGTDSFQVKINDTLFNAFSIIPISSSGTIAINAADSLGNKSVALTFKDTVRPGSYTFNLINQSGVYTLNSTNAYIPTIGTGLLQIIENNAISKRVRGNFSFVGKNAANPSDSARLTEGYFSVELP